MKSGAMAQPSRQKNEITHFGWRGAKHVTAQSGEDAVAVGDGLTIDDTRGVGGVYTGGVVVGEGLLF